MLISETTAYNPSCRHFFFIKVIPGSMLLDLVPNSVFALNNICRAFREIYIICCFITFPFCSPAPVKQTKVVLIKGQLSIVLVIEFLFSCLQIFRYFILMHFGAMKDYYQYRRVQRRSVEPDKTSIHFTCTSFKDCYVICFLWQNICSTVLIYLVNKLFKK